MKYVMAMPELRKCVIHLVGGPVAASQSVSLRPRPGSGLGFPWRWPCPSAGF